MINPFFQTRCEISRKLLLKEGERIAQKPQIQPNPCRSILREGARLKLQPATRGSIRVAPRRPVFLRHFCWWLVNVGQWLSRTNRVKVHIFYGFESRMALPLRDRGMRTVQDLHRAIERLYWRVRRAIMKTRRTHTQSHSAAEPDTGRRKPAAMSRPPMLEIGAAIRWGGNWRKKYAKRTQREDESHPNSDGAR
jgi:hypothetical protein